MNAFQGIELTSRCNLHCRYCPHPRMRRAKIDMTEKVFARALEWLDYFQQWIVHLHMIGESTLHPKLPEWIARVANVVDSPCLSTNGVGVTEDLLRSCKLAGLSKLTISVHRPEIAQRTALMCHNLRIPWEWGDGPLRAHDWAGQVDTPFFSNEHPECDFLKYDGGVVLSDGRIATCCLDAEGISAKATVWDDLRQVRNTPFALCQSCHHRVPRDKFPEWEKGTERRTNLSLVG